MRPYFLLLCHLLTFAGAYGQEGQLDKDTLKKENINELRRKNASLSAHNFIREFNKLHGILTLPMKSIGSSKTLSSIIQSNRQATAAANSAGNAHLAALSGNPPCKDSSFEKLINLTNSVLYITSLIHTHDDGVLFVGQYYDSTIYHDFLHFKGLLFKTDQNGQVLWVKTFDDGNHDQFYQIYLMSVFELPSGDIMIAGGLDTVSNSYNTTTVIFRLNSIGTIVWDRTYVSAISVANQWAPIDFRSITEAPNGDLILCGTTFNNAGVNNYETIVRMSSAGKVIWDSNIGNFGDYKFGAEGLAAYFENGNIIEVGITHGDGTPGTVAAVNLLTLDFSSGNVLNRNFYIPDFANQQVAIRKQFSSYYNYCTRMQNGHLIINGHLFANYLPNPSSTVVDHFGIVEIDENQNLIVSYSISSTLKSSDNANQAFFDENGNGIFSIIDYPNDQSAFAYMGTLHNHHFSKERVVYYNNVSIGSNGSFGDNYRFCFFNDGGYLLGQSYYASMSLGASYVEFKKMHDADTSSNCTGRDTLFALQLPLPMRSYPGYPDLDNPVLNQISEVSYNLIPWNNLVSNESLPCRQQNFCDTIKIHGPTVFCKTSDPQIFTAFKNPSCGSFVQWNIDSSVVNSSTLLNDSSISILFNQVNWQGKIYARISQGQCTVAMTDSTFIHIAGASDTLNIGPDTTICNNNPITLHAGTQYASYQWQDGSTDSILTVTQPGKYFVTVKNYCGVQYRDSTEVSLAHYDLGIAKDTTVCTRDSITIIPASGYSNYEWTPLNYYMTADQANGHAIFYPLSDTSYIVSALQSGGCLVKDTIHFTVLNSPDVNIGKDTSLCPGQPLSLDAGPGFTSYSWNTGANAETLQVSNAGIYAVKVKATNGCSASDSILVKYLGLPVFSLGNDSFLCKGQQMILSPQQNPAGNYVWQDGSTNHSYTVDEPGLYSLTVTNTCGSSSDSINISSGVCKLQMPDAFTPNNDGKNDVFRVKYVYAVKEFHLKIFNRWGQLVFQSSDMRQGWDGTFNGQNQPTGGYVWFIDSTDSDGKKISLRGTVVLIR
ncbi:MAG: hypothetical protein C5B59_20265 [Bacteroidetes bacterium]|nr:MAG: hypothetical protein C5B59_20265 [Bacteroidota bacterium]